MTATFCDGLAKRVLSAGTMDATCGVIVLKVQVKSCCSTPSAADEMPFRMRIRYVVDGASALGTKR